MKKAILSTLAVVGFVVGAQAYQVTCNFALPHDGVLQETTKYVTTDFVEYKVVLGGGETLADFYVGYVVAPVSMYVSLGSQTKVDIGGWSVGASGVQESDTYTPDGIVSTAADGSIASLHWQGLSLTAGTYYFGYTVASGTYSLLDTGWSCDASDENWASAVSDGSGPVHTIPEPASCVLIGLGAAALALRRRFHKA